MFSFKGKIKKVLAEADILIDGARAWDIQVHDERLYRRVFARGSIGLVESYMDGWWDCKKLDEFFYRILRGRLHTKNEVPGQALFHLLSNIINRQTERRSLEVGERHYDIGNDLY